MKKSYKGLNKTYSLIGVKFIWVLISCYIADKLSVIDYTSTVCHIAMGVMILSLLSLICSIVIALAYEPAEKVVSVTEKRRDRIQESGRYPYHEAA